jgi:hypothetical protein
MDGDHPTRQVLIGDRLEASITDLVSPGLLQARSNTQSIRQHAISIPISSCLPGVGVRCTPCSNAGG